MARMEEGRVVHKVLVGKPEGTPAAEISKARFTAAMP